MQSPMMALETLAALVLTVGAPQAPQVETMVRLEPAASPERTGDVEDAARQGPG